jgi:hypothetical protein
MWRRTGKALLGKEDFRKEEFIGMEDNLFSRRNESYRK